MAETYCYTMDMYPQQYEDVNRVHHFYEVLREQSKLITTKCVDCGAVLWPPRVVCRECLSDNLEWVDLPEEGTISSFSVSVAGVAPQFKPPVIYSVIDFENGVRIVSPIVDTDPEDIEVGKKVVLQPVDVPPDHLGRKRVMFFFKLKK